ncbi:MAG: response regulator [candidate division Zixibacteria bacterium]|nr:response regulator [candidate division Zixibacteria bacterium]
MSDNNGYRLLLVDDDSEVLNSLEFMLKDDYDLVCASSGREAVECVKSDDSIAVVVMDIKMPRMDGKESADHITRLKPELNIIFHTGFPGQYDEEEIDHTFKPFGYVEKGASPCSLEREIRNAFENYVARQMNKQPVLARGSHFNMIGDSPKMQDVYNLIKRVAPSDTTVLITGETGTGKELVAHALHHASLRWEQPFIKINCGAITESLTEAELFGHEKGAFTDAKERKIGPIEQADGGSLFLDEITEMTLSQQKRFLHVLEDREISRVGGSNQAIKVDVRVISTSNRDLEKSVEEGEFRRDLFYRIHTVRIKMPSLAERIEDIPDLVRFFCDSFCREHNMQPRIFNQSATDYLTSCEWPGNVRQLKYVVEAATLQTPSGLIKADDLKKFVGNGFQVDHEKPHQGMAERVQNFKRYLIFDAGFRSRGNINAAARFLNVDSSNLRRMIKEFGIDFKRFADN